MPSYLIYKILITKIVIHIINKYNYCYYHYHY